MRDVAQAMHLAHEGGSSTVTTPEKTNSVPSLATRPPSDGEQTMKTHVSHTGRSGSPQRSREPFSGMRRVRVALYVRVSTDKQAEFGMSLDAQRRA